MSYLKEILKRVVDHKDRRSIFRKKFKYYRLYHPIGIWNRKRKQRKALIKWIEEGKPPPPPHIYQQALLRQYAREYGLNVFVETGTYCGDMVKALIGSMKRIYSIELGDELYKRTKTRFQNNKNVVLIHGDSSQELDKIHQKLEEPALFWLDGHFCGELTGKGEKETPIYKELEQILNTPCKEHVIIIDDARLFMSSDRVEYPTIDDIIQFVKSKSNNFDIIVQDDSFRITPKSKGSNGN